MLKDQGKCVWVADWNWVFGCLIQEMLAARLWITSFVVTSYTYYAGLCRVWYLETRAKTAVSPLPSGLCRAAGFGRARPIALDRGDIDEAAAGEH